MNGEAWSGSQWISGGEEDDKEDDKDEDEDEDEDEDDGQRMGPRKTTADEG